MTGFIRRVVTGHDKNGKAVVLSDELAPSVKTNPLRPGHRSTDIWKTSAAPCPDRGGRAGSDAGPAPDSSRAARHDHPHRGNPAGVG
jgi:hypothetical protein